VGDRAERRPEIPPLERYKRQLQEILDRRPSGVRQRLAEALGKNRSFVSQISNPAYSTPVPAAHLETIFEICPFSAAEREAFLAAYRQAHPRRLRVVQDAPRHRTVTLRVPDLGSARKNAELERLLQDLLAGIARLSEDED